MTPTEVIPVDASVQRIYDEVERLATTVQKRADVYARIQTMLLQATDIADWTLMGEHCHLGEGGAKKIARLGGVSVGPPREEKRVLEPDQKHGTGYLYRVEREFCVGRFDTSADVITEVGAASSRDSFFAETGRGDAKVYLSSWEIDETDIIKKASTNCLIRGVTSLLGIRNVTPDQLRAAGLDISKLRGIKYDGASKGGRGQQDSANVSAADLEAIKAKRAEIRTAVLEMSEGDMDGAKAMLAALTAFKGRDGTDVKGVATVDALNPPRLDIALEKIKKEHAEWAKAHPKQEAAVNG